MTTRIKVVPEDANESMYGPVEVAWFADHLEITALGAGRASVTDAHLDREDVVVEIRPPRLDDLMETVPGAD